MLARAAATFPTLPILLSPSIHCAALMSSRGTSNVPPQPTTRGSSFSAVGGEASANPKQNSFSVVTYNMLAKSLGTNTIPWVMTVSAPVQDQIEAFTGGVPFRRWVDEELKPEYMRHFHKNLSSGNYAAMRGFWAARRCEGPDDVPDELVGVKFVDEDQVSYPSRLSGGGEENSVVATTLRGVLRRILPETLALSLFEEVVTSEETIYAWPIRGPRIFTTVTSPSALAGSKSGADIVALQEYDCHDVLADYRGCDGHETFGEAMKKSGYDGAFFKDPLKTRKPPAGLGLFWRRDVFELEGVPPPSCGVIALEIDEDAHGGALYNADLREMWHANDSDGGGSASKPVLMRDADRRNAALATLRHRPSGRSVAVCTIHQMTTSRDGKKTNRFPGEVRAGELATVRALLDERVPASPNGNILLMGDFNIDAREGNVFRGTLPSAFAPDDGSVWEVDTGFDPYINAFRWGGRVLSDAFADVHKWGEGVGENEFCTSRNAVRTEWIDYMFHGQGLRPVGRSDVTTPSGPIPDEDHPSDHLPLHVAFNFV